MEGEVGAFEVYVMAFDGEGVCVAGFGDFGEVAKAEEVEFMSSFVAGVVFGEGSLFVINSLAPDFVSV